MRFTLALILLVSMVTVAVARTDEETLRLQGKVIELADSICKDPPTYGYTLSGGGEISGKAEVSKLLKHLADAGVSGSLKGNVIYWKGMSQNQVAGAIAARNSCALDATRYLFSQFTFFGANDGLPVPHPKNYAAAVKVVVENGVRPTPAVSQSIQGNGNYQFNNSSPTIVNPTLPPTELTLTQLGALCEWPTWGVPDKVTSFANLSDDELKRRADKYADQLEAIAQSLRRDRSKLLSEQTPEKPANFDAAVARAMEQYNVPLREQIHDVMFELLERHHAVIPHRVSDGLSLAGAKADCGDLSTDHGLDDYAGYIRNLADRPRLTSPAPSENASH